MATVTWQQPPTSGEAIDGALADLSAAKSRLSALSIDARLELLEHCLARVEHFAPEWVCAACEAKGIPEQSPARSEEVLAGPVATARHLRLLIQTYTALKSTGKVQLPGGIELGPHGGLCVPVMPAPGMFDPIVFAGFSANCWLDPRIGRDDLDRLGERILHPRPANCVLVLGAGNVSSIPPTDTISKIFQEGHVVLLKMNPVNEYLGETFSRIFEPLISAGFLRIVYGGPEVGAMSLAHPSVNEVHITGSIHSHDAIVWGASGPERERRRREHDPLLKKPITSELGNVSPWIIVPGPYSFAQLRFQAENVAASIVNNASFNCVATKVIVTSKSWPQRDQFLGLLEGVLAQVPPRRAYYPGARDRFHRFSPIQFPHGTDETLPWTLVRDIDPQVGRHMLQEESFVCVCAETTLEAEGAPQFLDRAVEFVNENVWGTLAAAITLHPSARRDRSGEKALQAAFCDLRYGAIGVNHWPGLMYAMMSPPWGGYPSGTLANAQSGIGTVHNTFLLEGVQKTVLEGPLTVSPKPVWFPTHRRPEAVTWNLLKLYAHPSVWRLPALMVAAMHT